MTEFRLAPHSIPTSIAVSGDVVWYADIGRNLIGRVAPSSGRVREFPTPTMGAGPEHIVADPASGLGFTEEAAGQVAASRPPAT